MLIKMCLRVYYMTSVFSLVYMRTIVVIKTLRILFFRKLQHKMCIMIYEEAERKPSSAVDDNNNTIILLSSSFFSLLARSFCHRKHKHLSRRFENLLDST